jgi:peptide subunit release factor 1 (eRF1)
MSTTSLANWPKAAGAVNELEPLLARLTAIEPDGHQVISCYLRLEPEDRARSRYLREVRARIRQLEQDPLLLAADDQARDAVRRDLARIVAFLGQPAGLPHAPGLALFACEELELFAAVPLPSVHRTRVVLEDTPWVAELMAVRQEMAPVVVALLDRAHARFFEVTPLAAIELAGLTAPARRGGRFHSDRADAPGWGEGDYHRRIREERQRRYALVAERLEALVAGRPVRGIVLAGPKDHTAALARHLNRRLARLLLGTCTLNPTAAHTAQVQAAALRAARDHERAASRSELRGLEDALGRGWGVEGGRETLRALARGQVHTLFAQEDRSAPGYRCATTRRLVLGREDCRGEGEAQPVRDIVDEAIEEAMRQRAGVVMIPSEAGVAPLDGLAATLRFR